jgi:hypothetical protein
MLVIVSRYSEDSMRLLSALLLASLPGWAQLPTCAVPRWNPCDLVFELAPGEDLATAELRAEFRSPRRESRTIRAFREDGRLVLRFTPDEVGEWDYRLTSSLRRLDGQIGKATGTASDAPGFVRVANVHHFQTADLQPHLWMGTAIENFAAIPREQFDAQLAARAAEKFTHIRVTLDPSTDLREAAERVRAIHSRGLVTDLALATLPEDRRERERYITEVAARFSAFNIIWAGVPAFEKLRGARAVLRETAQLLAQLDPYRHPRTTLAESTSFSLAADGWMQLIAYGTADPNVGAVERQQARLPSINSGIRTRAELWNATMNGHYPAAGSGAEFTVWFDFMSRTRYWEMQPYFDVSGGRAIAVRDVELAREGVIDAVEYVVYVEKPGPVELTVDNQSYDVAWINPATGERIPAKKYKGRSFTGEPPSKAHDWILHVSREGHKESLLKRYKFDSRPVLLQQPETDPNVIPFEIEAPAGDILTRAPVPFALKINRATRATRNLLVLWTAEVTGGAEGARVVGAGTEGLLALPEVFRERLPAVMTLHVQILNANGKLYLLDRALRLLP